MDYVGSAFLLSHSRPVLLSCLMLELEEINRVT